MYNSNTVLPINLIEEYIGSRNLKIIQVSSYFQLLGLEFQTPYSLTKSLGDSYLAQNYNEVSFIYLFDTFGSQDDRNKVVDTFIKKVRDGDSIALPKGDVSINLSHVSDVCRAIVNSIDLPHGKYCILSQNTVSLRYIAEQIMRNIGNRVPIVELPDNIDYFHHLNKDNLPKYFPSFWCEVFRGVFDDANKRDSLDRPISERQSFNIICISRRMTR